MIRVLIIMLKQSLECRRIPLQASDIQQATKEISNFIIIFCVHFQERSIY